MNFMKLGLPRKKTPPGDEVSTPTGVWAAFNQLRGPKEAVPMIDSPHNHLATPAEQDPYTRRSAEWLDMLVHGVAPLGETGQQ